MGDIYAGIAVMGALGGALCVHSFVLLDNLRLAWFLPFSNLVAVGNGSSLAAGFLAGIGR